MNLPATENKELTLLALAAAIISCLLAGGYLLQSQKYFYAISDAPEYVIVGKMLLQGLGSKVYDPKSITTMRHRLFTSLRERSITVFSPPPGIILFAPFGFLDDKALRILWPFANILISCLSIFFLAYAFHLKKKNFLLLLAVSALYWPLFESLRIGQISPILLFALSLATFFFRTGRSYAGILTLCLFAIKPQYLLPFIAYLFGAHKYRLLSVGSLALLILALLAMFIIGAQGYAQYLQLMSGLEHYDMLPEINPTVRGQLLRFPEMSTFMVSIISNSAWLMTVISGYLLGSRTSKMTTNNLNWFDLWLISVLPVSLLTASFCHTYDLVLLIPCALALLASGIREQLATYPWLFLPGMILVLMFSFPVAIELHKYFVLRSALVNPFFIMLLVFALFSTYVGWQYCLSNKNR